MDKKKTNKRQFASLVAFMEQHPELAKGYKFVSSRESVTALWWTLTDSLNSLGPPTRSVASWQKVWTDKKLQLKRKLQHNRNELTATGGGPNTLQSFNDLEETIIRLVSLERAVNHNGSVFGVPPTTDPPFNEKPIEEPRSEPTFMEAEPTHADAAREDVAEKGQSDIRGRGRATKRNFRKVLLEKQTDDLCKMKRHVSNCAYYSRKSYELHTKRFALEKKRFNLAEDKFRIKKQMMLEKQKHKSEQLQYQLQLLEYKKQKLNFDMGRTTTRNADAPDDHVERDEDDGDD